MTSNTRDIELHLQKQTSFQYTPISLVVILVLVSGAKQAVETTQDQECEVELVVKYINEVKNKF
ncbi:hypothetical protein KSB_55910 [Ktedonobacter robiniae]|uniref:Uncharacterized protein n=1 Tax=Ktedonobacter robiniae TaxID=2778365 RepID=A0ABQ3UWA9_9CHLR|nr:hypothetical protein KSB_55910 [Ktedonobacter robiniae]